MWLLKEDLGATTKQKIDGTIITPEVDNPDRTAKAVVMVAGFAGKTKAV